MQKKSLTSNLKTTKKPSVAAAPAKKEGGSTRKTLVSRGSSTRYGKATLSDFSFT